MVTQDQNPCLNPPQPKLSVSTLIKSKPLPSGLELPFSCVRQSSFYEHTVDFMRFCIALIRSSLVNRVQKKGQAVVYNWIWNGPFGVWLNIPIQIILQQTRASVGRCFFYSSVFGDWTRALFQWSLRANLLLSVKFHRSRVALHFARLGYMCTHD